MADDQPPQAPPPPRPAPVDEGIAAWGKLVHDHLRLQSGVEIVGTSGGSTHFKFRGQTFAVHVHRTG